MKTTTLREAKEQLSQFVTAAQTETVLITKHGKPAALVVGVERHDLEDIFYMTNRPFWRNIRRRRCEKGIPWKKAKAQL